MSQEKDFHRIIREKLEQFNADNSPNDWQQMKRKLLISNLLRYALPSLAVLMIGLSFYWFKSSETITPNEVILRVPETIPVIAEIKEAKPKQIIAKNSIKKEEKKLNIPTENPVFPELFNETIEVENGKVTELKIEKIAPRKISIPEIHTNGLAEKEIRFMSASAVSMSDKISRVRQLGKTYELTSYQALDRNIEKWKNIVIVCDITTSMFPYTTQVFDWMNENNDNTTIKGVVFFTDCDSLGKQTRGRLPGKDRKSVV